MSKLGREGEKQSVSDDAHTGDRPSNHVSAARSRPTGERYCGEEAKESGADMIRRGLDE